MSLICVLLNINTSKTVHDMGFLNQVIKVLIAATISGTDTVFSHVETDLETYITICF